MFICACESESTHADRYNNYFTGGTLGLYNVTCKRRLGNSFNPFQTLRQMVGFDVTCE